MGSVDPQRLIKSQFDWSGNARIQAYVAPRLYSAAQQPNAPRAPLSTPKTPFFQHWYPSTTDQIRKENAHGSEWPISIEPLTDGDACAPKNNSSSSRIVEHDHAPSPILLFDPSQNLSSVDTHWPDSMTSALEIGLPLSKELASIDFAHTESGDISGKASMRHASCELQNLEPGYEVVQESKRVGNPYRCDDGVVDVEIHRDEIVMEIALTPRESHTGSEVEIATETGHPIFNPDGDDSEDGMAGIEKLSDSDMSEDTIIRDIALAVEEAMEALSRLRSLATLSRAKSYPSIPKKQLGTRTRAIQDTWSPTTMSAAEAEKAFWTYIELDLPYSEIQRHMPSYTLASLKAIYKTKHPMSPRRRGRKAKRGVGRRG
ncbi:hypothetical protein EG329_003749 [Mollisiaceae sp. DMI_Dod_QoI]|nr:hypothetical protein EG329_003749 [Helotiales sp. DMI_Dod_QoI]